MPGGSGGQCKDSKGDGGSSGNADYFHAGSFNWWNFIEAILSCGPFVFRSGVRIFADGGGVLIFGEQSANGEDVLKTAAAIGQSG